MLDGTVLVVCGWWAQQSGCEAVGLVASCLLARESSMRLMKATKGAADDGTGHVIGRL
nr:hypothetical protein OG409_01210 [Streptomyces sp. NBC_00974]